MSFYIWKLVPCLDFFFVHVMGFFVRALLLALLTLISFLSINRERSAHLIDYCDLLRIVLDLLMRCVCFYIFI